MKSNQVSCVIPYAGAAKYIREVVFSALSQQFAEVVIVNDGFPSEQLDSISALPSVRTVHLTTSTGCPNARNLGIKACSTPYVVLLDHDDILCDGYFNAMSAWMVKHQLRCAAAKVRYIGDNRKRVGAALSHDSSCTLPSGFLSEASLIAEVGYFPDSYSDDLLFFRELRKATKLTTCPDAIVLYRIHPQAESSRNPKAWWTFNQLLPLYDQGRLTLAEMNIIAREFANNGVTPAGMESRFSHHGAAYARLLSRSAYACWLNRDWPGVARYGFSLFGHLPELGRIARRKWLRRTG